MKKFFLFAAALLISMAAMSQVDVNGINYSITSDSTVSVFAHYPIYSGDIVIPAKVTIEDVEYTVTGIEPQAFYYCEELTSVVLPNTIKAIGYNAFDHCTALTSINFPEGLEIIEGDAFWGCENLTEITLPSTLKELYDWAFEQCINLRSINLPEALEYVGYAVFYGDDALTEPLYNSKFFAYFPRNYATSYSVPEGIETIVGMAFNSSNELKSVTLPSSLRFIGSGAFCKCTSLASLTLPEGLETIESDAFWGCEGLTSLVIPASVTELHANSFPSSLTSISVAADNETYVSQNNCILRKGTNELVYACNGAIIPDGLTAIGEYAFASRDDLTSFVVPSTVTSIGEWAFVSCHNLKSITLPDTLVYLGNGAFNDCVSLTSITLPEGLKYVPSDLCNNCTNLTEVNLPSTVTNIGSYAFYYCTSLESIVLPDNVEVIETEAFSYSGLKNPLYTKKIFFWMPTSYEGAYVLGDQIETIADYAFQGCDKLISVTFPASLRQIGYEAFGYCYGLTSIELPEGLETINEWAFEVCQNVETLVLPSTLTHFIGNYAFAFYGDSKLKTIYNYATTPYADDDWWDPFLYVPDQDQITLYVPDASVEAYKAAEWWKEFDVQPMSNAPQAIGQVQGDNVQGTKRLINGQLLIEKNGKTYTITGAQVK